MNPINFECPQCGYKFCNWMVTVPKGELHTSRKPYLCVECGVLISRGSIYFEDRRKATQWQAGDRYHMDCARERGFVTSGASPAAKATSGRRKIRLE